MMQGRVEANDVLAFLGRILLYGGFSMVLGLLLMMKIWNGGRLLESYRSDLIEFDSRCCSLSIVDGVS
jgi:hypothetical protein